MKTVFTKKKNVSGPYLVRVRYVDRLSALGHVPNNASAPRYVNLFLFLHFLQCGTGTHVEQFGHQTFGLAALSVV